MGIDVHCNECDFEGKQCFVYKRLLLDALRRFLKNNAEKYPLELKYINFHYRYEEDDKDRVLEMTEKDQESARDLMKENGLDGLFVWIDLQQDDYISVYRAIRFLKAFDMIKHCMEGRFLDYSILAHAASKGHSLQCW